MSHSVTVTRTTTSMTTSTSYIVLNTGYLKTISGLLKLIQLVSNSKLAFLCLLLNMKPTRNYKVCHYIQLIGAVMVGIFGYFHRYGFANHWYVEAAELFCFLMATTFMIGTFCLLLSCLVSLNTGAIISKTIFVSMHFAFL